MEWNWIKKKREIKIHISSIALFIIYKNFKNNVDPASG